MADINESGPIDDQLNNSGSSSDITGSTDAEESDYYESDEYTEDDGSGIDQNETKVVVEMQPKTTESDIEKSVRHDASVTEGNAAKESIEKQHIKSSESESDENALNLGHVSEEDAVKESGEMQAKETEIDVDQSARNDASISEVMIERNKFRILKVNQMRVIVTQLKQIMQLIVRSIQQRITLK